LQGAAGEGAFEPLAGAVGGVGEVDEDGLGGGAAQLAPGRAQRVERPVFGDAQKPGAHRRAADERREAPVRVDENFLPDVFGQGFVGDDAQAEGEHDRALGLHQELERGLVSALLEQGEQGGLCPPIRQPGLGRLQSPLWQSLAGAGAAPPGMALGRLKREACDVCPVRARPFRQRGTPAGFAAGMTLSKNRGLAHGGLSRRGARGAPAGARLCSDRRGPTRAGRAGGLRRGHPVVAGFGKAERARRRCEGRWALFFLLRLAKRNVIIWLPWVRVTSAGALSVSECACCSPRVKR
jgi:hypothetical protein